MDDLGPEELGIQRLLGAVRPAPLPLGFRDAVMQAVRAEGESATWEWIVAAALALPSLAYLAWELALHGAELGAAFSAIVTAAQGLEQTTGAAFAIDGLAVIAFALVGIASVVAAHALLREPERRHVVA